MTPDRQQDLQIPGPNAVASLPPATMGETGWDILLALRAEASGELSLQKLGARLSVPPLVRGRWLTRLNDRWLVLVSRDKSGREGKVILTSYGREVVDAFLSVVGAL